MDANTTVRAAHERIAVTLCLESLTRELVLNVAR